MAFVTAAEYKTSRKIAGSDFDTEITAFIASAQEMAERYCGYSDGGFEQAERTYNLDGSGNQRLILPDAPIDTGSTVTVLIVADDDTTDTLAATNYRVDGPRGEIHRLAYDGDRTRFDGPDNWGYSPIWKEGVLNYRVTCTTGWVVSGEDDNRPQGLVEAVYGLVDALGAERGSSAFRSQQASGSQNFTRMDPHAQMSVMRWWFGPYRRSSL